MEELELIRCDSLDTASLSDQDLLTTMEQLTFGPEALELPAGPEPSPTELAQCEAEVGTLLTIIAELNKKMGSLKAPSDPGGVRTSAASRPLVPDLLSHRLKQPERTRVETASPKPAFMDQGAGVVWSRLQDVLSSVEESVSFRKSWAAPITAVDLNKHREHLRAAQRSSAKASQILEDMEREFGISCTTVTQEENALQNQQEVLERAHCISLMEEDRDKLVNLHRVWRSGPHSPTYRPSAGSSTVSMSPDWASPPYPGSPLPQRRATRGPTSLCGTRDSGNIPCSSPVGPEVETDRLNRLVERLRSRNERLALASERRKNELEHMSLSVTRLEAHCSGLQLALRYGEECEEAYAELLSLYEARAQSVSQRRASAAPLEEAGNAPNHETDTEELSTSFSTAGGAVDHQTIRTPEEERERSLRQHIEALKRERAAMSLPRTECKPIPGSPSGHTHKEKAPLFYELISAREEMSDLRALIRLKEKELRCIEWSLMAQKEASGTFIPERDELEQHCSDQQRLCEVAAKLCPEGDHSRPTLKLHAVLHREQALKKRLALLQDSVNTGPQDPSVQRRDSGEMARLTQAHSKALSSYRQMKRKYREHAWRLEQKVVAMMEAPGGQEAQNTIAGDHDWRREETVL